MATAVRSHSKINLGLWIGAPRQDGFHGLSTVYQTLELHDIVEVSARPAAKTRLKLNSNDVRVPTDARNTAWKMVALALEALDVAAEVEITIHKRLPVQGGLGAGSANAVAALIGLEREFEKLIAARPEILHDYPGLRKLSSSGLSDWQISRLDIAAQVGSDVPLFLIGGAVLGIDRGQEVAALDDFESTWCVIALPANGVSTPKAFADWDELCRTQNLTPGQSTDKLNRLSQALADGFLRLRTKHGTSGSSGVLADGQDLAPQALVHTGIFSWIENDFEKVVFPQQPSLSEIKRQLAAQGTSDEALYAALSGSGSALFGLYSSHEKAIAAVHRLRADGTECQLTRTLPRSEYWSQMLV